MRRLLCMITLMSMSLGACAAEPVYDPILLHSYFTNMRQIHAPLFSAMETYCQNQKWPSGRELNHLLTSAFGMHGARLRTTYTARNTLAMQYQPWPDPEWYATLAPGLSKSNHRTYFKLHLSSIHKHASIGIDGVAYCQENRHLSDIALVLRAPNETSPASLAEVIQQRQFAESGKTPHLDASYRG